MQAPFYVEKTTATVHHVTHRASGTNMGGYAPAEARRQCSRLNRQRVQAEAQAAELAGLDRIIAGAQA